MSFNIEFDKDKPTFGCISINDFSDSFESSFNHWSEEKYEKIWLENCNLICDGASKAALITLINNPKYSNFIRWWVKSNDLFSVIFK